MPTGSECSALAWRSELRSRTALTTLISAFCLLGILPVEELVLAQSERKNEAVTCATCHAGLDATYEHAGMRHALEVEGANPVLQAHPLLTTRQGEYTYTVQTKDGHSTYTVTDGASTLELPIRWIFGAHSQTWVLEKDGNFYESMVSYFREEQALATTPGDGNITPHDVTEAVGRRLSIWEVLQCFNCHATGATSGSKLTLLIARPGVGCERCHAGTGQHMADAVKNNFKTVPAPLKKLSPEEAVNFCGQCHRTWSSALRNDWHGPSDVRFQPYRLENSRCYVGNDPRISCLACHDPHQPLNDTSTSYDSKCLACHAKGSAASDGSAIKLCPVSKVNCVGCHMPKVELPGGHAKFTDHMIRVTRPGEPYPD